MIPHGNARALTRALVAVDSRNPSLAADGPGEAACARLLAETLRAWEFRVELQETARGRPNVVARVGPAGGAALMFNGHLDTVGFEGLTHAPLGEERDGRLYGRGSADMKGGVAAMCAAAARAAASGSLQSEIVIAAVTDEEFSSLGTRALLDGGVRADACVVTEPTRLAIMPAHRGFAWLTLIVHGRAAHGSRYDVGVDAIRLAALVLAELDAYEYAELVTRTHPLLGRASLHASLVEGGIGISTYPDRCTVRIERRTLPGETGEDALRELEDAIARVRARRPELRTETRIDLAMPPSDVSPAAPVVRALDGAVRDAGVTPRLEGMSAWTDCALLNAAGIPAVCFGPGDIGVAHAATEWIELAEVERATDVLERLAAGWHRNGVPASG